MSLKNTLTNEKLCKRFDNPFDLVNYAISLTRKIVNRGEELDTNPVNDVLEAIASGTDRVEPAEEESDAHE